MTQQRIREWYEYWDGMVYVSFSGGKDSTVLLHLVRELYPDVPAVFSDTGLEFPEIREFVKTIPNVTWLKPDMTFRKVLEKYGYPVIGKEQAKWIDEARRRQCRGSIPALVWHPEGRQEKHLPHFGAMALPDERAIQDQRRVLQRNEEKAHEAIRP